MAQVTGPLMSLTAKGSIGNAITFTTWKGIDVCKGWFTPANPNAPSQLVIRGYFSTAVTAWHGETSATRTLWTTYSHNHSLKESGFNLYVGKYIDFLINNSGTPPSVTNNPPNMT